MKFTHKIKYNFSEIFVMIKRCLIHSLRNSDTLVTTFFVPVMLMLFFVYVFGGAINTGNINYINYVISGIILVCIGYCSNSTAVSINNDITKGIMTRFYTMPISRSSVLIGHVFDSIIRNLLSTILILIMGFLMGFQPNAGLSGWFLFIIFLLLYLITISFVSMVFGLLANSAEGASSYIILITFLPFLSSAFVPTNTMPNILHIFAENQPLTPINDTIRSLLLGLPVGNNAIISVIWCAGIIVISYILVLILYNYKIKHSLS